MQRVKNLLRTHVVKVKVVWSFACSICSAFVFASCIVFQDMGSAGLAAARSPQRSKVDTWSVCSMF